MASYTRKYPNTNSTLTINYPDGLFSRIVEDPRTLYIVPQEKVLRHTPYYYDNQGNKIYKTDKDYSRLAYPDLILIPANGSFIKATGNWDHTQIVRHFYKDANETWQFDDNTGKPQKYNSGYYPSVENKPIWFGEEDSSIIDEQCYSCMAITIHEGMENNDIFEGTPSNLDDIQSYRTIERHVTITIYGETNFFKSNADYYCCYGNSDKDGTMYCSAYFGTKQEALGGLHIWNKDNSIIEYRPFSLTRRCNGGTYLGGDNETIELNFSDCHLDDVVPSYNKKYKELQYKDCVCEGFRFSRSLNKFWGQGLTIQNSEPLFKEEQLTYRNSNVQFIIEPMVAISTGYSPIGDGTYYYLSPQSSTDEQEECPPSIGLSYDVNFDNPESYSCVLNMWENWKWNGEENPHYILPFIKYANLCKAMDRYCATYVFMPMSVFKANGYSLNYIYGYDNGVKFSGYFTTEDRDRLPSQYLVAPWEDEENQNNVPLYEYGATLYPVMMRPQCMYLKLNTDKALDDTNLFGDITTNHTNIVKKLDETYGENNYIKRNITEWDEETMGKELLKLSLSPCKFKILYINCHGGQYDETQESYAVLSKTGNGNNYFTKGWLDYLLKNRRKDEYYFIYLASCFSGGLMEAQVHTNVESSDYTDVSPDPELGGGYFIWYSDCANSPAWGQTGGDGVCDLFDFKSDKTYKEHATTINSIVSECRTKNIQLLVDFLSEHYIFMRDTLLDKTSLNWTDETYNKSLTNAANLIIRLSKERENNVIKESNGEKRYEIRTEYSQILKQYPIMILFHLLFKLNKYDNIVKNLKPITKSSFMSRIKGYFNYIDNTIEILGKHSIRLNNRDEEHEYLFNTELWEENIENTPSEKKELLTNYINFFYDLYNLVVKIINQSQKIYDINHFGFHTNILNSLIDDIPGMVVSGSQFEQCKFPKFPGYVATQDRISQQMRNKLLYKYNGGVSQ